jgi:hypothetical protein
MENKVHSNILITIIVIRRVISKLVIDLLILLNGHYLQYSVHACTCMYDSFMGKEMETAVLTFSLSHRRWSWPGLFEGLEVFRGCALLWGSVGVVPQKIFEIIWSPEKPFPAFWALHLFFKFVLTVLVFRTNIKKSVTLRDDPPCWCLNTFLGINCFNISSIRNSNMEYQSFLQGVLGGGGGGGGGGAVRTHCIPPVDPPLFLIVFGIARMFLVSNSICILIHVIFRHFLSPLPAGKHPKY